MIREEELRQHSAFKPGDCPQNRTGASSAEDILLGLRMAALSDVTVAQNTLAQLRLLREQLRQEMASTSLSPDATSSTVCSADSNTSSPPASDDENSMSNISGSDSAMSRSSTPVTDEQSANPFLEVNDSTQVYG